MKFTIKKFTIELATNADGKIMRVTNWGNVPRLKLTTPGYITRKDLIDLFEPADCDALNLVDPDRTERLCKDD